MADLTTDTDLKIYRVRKLNEKDCEYRACNSIEELERPKVAVKKRLLLRKKWINELLHDFKSNKEHIVKNGKIDARQILMAICPF